MTGARKDPAFMSSSQQQQPAAAAAHESADAAVIPHEQQPTGAAQMDLDGRCASALTATKMAWDRFANSTLNQLMPQLVRSGALP